MSKEIYRQNMKAFEKNYPQYAHMVRTAKIDNRYTVEPSKRWRRRRKIKRYYFYSVERIEKMGLS